MVSRSNIALVLVLIAYAIGMIVFALFTGEIKGGKFDWVRFADNPTGFRNWFFFHVIAAASLVFLLWNVRNRPRG